MMGKATISDIAALVGVSKATVSYYLNGNFKKMSVETQERIRKAIEVTGYRPNKIARSLVTKETSTIGVVIADITNPFISSVMKGIHDTCTEYGYTVNFTNSDNDVAIEMENLDRLKQQSVSGIILDSVAADNPQLRDLERSKTVMVDRQAKELCFDTIVSDNKASTHKFLRLMKEAGYHDIYFVTFPMEGISTREQRYEGFKEVVSDKPEKLLVLGDKGTEKRILEIIQSKAKGLAFFTMNGPTLLRFMKILNQSDFSYPEDFGLGSYEDLEWMEVLNPNVSCIRQDSYRIGCVAAERLIQKLKKYPKGKVAELLEVPSQIILRKSF